MGLERHAEHPFLQLLASAAFINQLIGGVVQMDIQFRKRIMLFLFGGEDARIDPTEERVMEVWFAELAHSIHRRTFGKSGYGRSPTASRRKFPSGSKLPNERRSLQSLRAWIRWQVAMTGFDHIDLQKMVITEDQDLQEHRADMLNRLQLSVGNPDDA